MKKDSLQKIHIPEGIEAHLEENTLTVKGPKGENKRTFEIGQLSFEKKDDSIIIGTKKLIKREKKKINTIVAHIENMIKGVKEGFEYKLKVVFIHFPISVDIKGKEATIKNFLGEKTPRKVKIREGAEVKVDRDLITINSINKELAGQTAADFEIATKIKGRDRRVFQDGIFIINKNGKEI